MKMPEQPLHHRVKAGWGHQRQRRVITCADSMEVNHPSPGKPSVEVWERIEALLPQMSQIDAARYRHTFQDCIEHRRSLVIQVLHTDKLLITPLVAQGFQGAQ